MPRLFADFDFALLDDPDFREDSVREELIVPLLTALGFSASPPFRIIRSKPWSTRMFTSVPYEKA